MLQELFPESYAETAAWLRREVNAHGDSLARCEQQLQAAVEQDPEFQVLAAGCQVSMSLLRKVLCKEHVMSSLPRSWNLMAGHDCNPLQSRGGACVQCCSRSADATRCVHACSADRMHMTHVHMLHMLHVLMHGHQCAC